MATISRYTYPSDTDKPYRWRVRYRTPDRKQTDKRGFKTKREAEDFAATVEVSKLRGEYIEPSASKITVGELGEAWIQRQTHLKPSSLRSITTAWNKHVSPRWGDTAISEIRFSAVQTWISDTGKTSGATVVVRNYGVLAKILDDAVKDRRILTNPARGVELPRKPKKRQIFLTHEQAHKIAEEAGDHGTLVLVLAYLGLRWGEAVALRVRDCDLLRGRLTISENAVKVGAQIHVGTPKNHKNREVPVPKFLLERIARQCEGKDRSDLLFPGLNGDYLRLPNSKRNWLRGAVQRAGLPDLTAHDLRHSAASFAVSAGANVKAVQRMLGHSSAAMTLDIYASLFDDDLEGVAMALDHAVSSSSVGKLWANNEK